MYLYDKTEVIHTTDIRVRKYSPASNVNITKSKKKSK